MEAQCSKNKAQEKLKACMKMWRRHSCLTVHGASEPRVEVWWCARSKGERAARMPPEPSDWNPDPHSQSVSPSSKLQNTCRRHQVAPHLCALSFGLPLSIEFWSLNFPSSPIGTAEGTRSMRTPGRGKKHSRKPPAGPLKRLRKLHALPGGQLQLGVRRVQGFQRIGAVVRP